MLDRVPQLSDVAGPAVVHHALQHVARDPADVVSMNLSQLVNEPIHQQGDVFFALTQRRQMHLKHVDAVIEIFPKVARGDQRLEVAIRRRHEPHVDLHRFVVADAPNLAFLQDSQQLQLNQR